MAMLIPLPKFSALDDDGNPLVGGKLYAFEAGTSTPQDTFTDQSGGVANTHPVILNARGEAAVWLDDANYKFVLYDADDNLIWSEDNVASFADGSVTTSKLADGSVTTAKIANAGVTTAKIANAGVTTAKIANSNVTYEKLEDSNIGITSSSSTQTNLLASGAVDVTNLSQSLETHGRPVLLKIISDGSGNSSFINVFNLSSTDADVEFIFFRDATEIGRYTVGITVGGASAVYNQIPFCAISHLDNPSAGTYTYKVQMDTTGGTSTQISYAKLVAVEL